MFGFVGIDIECKIFQYWVISGSLYRLPNRLKMFFLPYPQPLTQSEIFIKNALKTTKMQDKSVSFLKIQA